MRLRIPIATFFCGFLLLAPLAALAQGTQNAVNFTLSLGDETLQPGGESTAILHALIGPGWHLYSLTKYPEDSIAPQPTTITLVDNDLVSLAGEVRQGKPKVSFDENFGLDTEYFDGRADFEIPIRFDPSTPVGEQTVTARVRFMACNDRLCLPPQIRVVSATIQIEGEPVEPAGSASLAVAPPPTEVTPPAQDADTREVATTSEIPRGVWAYIWFAMAMGGLALLTPCVFPMIPITVSYFTKRDVSRGRAAAEAALYSAGIVLTFTVLGFLLTALFGAGGINRIASSPWVNILIATIFVVFALSLFGVLEIRVPSGWLTAIDRKSSKVGGPIGILLMALTFSLTSFTCTVPFVGTVMVAATNGDWLWSLLGITAFATVFSLPFFLLALFPSWLKSLPKSGGWMDSLKVVMGFLELAAAMKFLSNVDLVFQWEFITRPVFITVWLALALVTSVYLLGRFRFAHEMKVDAIGVGRVFGAVFFLSVSFYLLRGLFGFPLGELDAFLPPRDYGNVAAFSLPGSGGQSAQSERWYTNYSEALQIAKVEQKPVFVDFTGYTCTNCRWMEANIFVKPRVQELFSEFVLVRLYTDGGKEEHEANLNFEQERFGTIALPLYALMTPDDRIIETFAGLTRNESEFVGFLEKGLQSKGQTLVAKD